MQAFFESMPGIVLTVLIAFVALLVGVGYFHAKERKRNSVKILVFSAVAIALGTALSMVSIVKIPQGGSLTLFSMFIVSMIGYFFGPVQGILCGIAYGMLQLAIGPYVVHPAQLLLDYPIAFGMLGLSGFFHKRSDGLIPGYIVGVFGRLVCSVLSGVIFFAEYAEGTGLSPFAYSLAYNLAYMGGEAMLTCVLLILPPVRNAIGYIRRFVLSE